MKKLILILFILFSINAISQNPKMYTSGGFVIVDQNGFEFGFNPSQTNYELRST